MKSKILVIDDDKDLADLIKNALELKGYSAVAINEGKRAMDVIKRESPDVILLDVRLQDADGYQVCDAIKSKDSLKHIPVIILTGQETERELVKDVHNFYGANDYIAKPFELEDLIKKIQKLLTPKKKII